MSAPGWTGLVIRRHTEDGYRDEGRIVHEDLEAGCYYWMPLPELDKHGRRLKFHLKRPLVGYQSELEGLLGTEPGRVSLVPYQPSGLQSHSEATLVDMAADPSRKDRRDIERSLEVMREQWGWIEPFVVRSSIEYLLDETAVLAFAKSRAKSIGVSAKRIQRAMRAYLLGGRAKEALLPRWDRCNPPGKPKLPRLDPSGKPTRRAGRRSIAVRSGFEDRAGIALPEEARRVLRHGWRKYMKRGVTVKRAYALTLAEFYSASSKNTGRGLEITLLPENMVPTIHQFRRHGPGAEPGLSVSRINLGQHRYARNHRPLHGTARDGLMAACQLAYIDSTPEDQNLVSQADPTVLMPQSYNTKVVEGYTNYIAGFYSSFERPSTLTALAALGHAEQDKVEFCRRYGVEITSDEWLPLAFKTVRADNGEVKSEEGIHAMSWSEISAESPRVRMLVASIEPRNWGR